MTILLGISVAAGYVACGLATARFCYQRWPHEFRYNPGLPESAGVMIVAILWPLFAVGLAAAGIAKGALWVCSYRRKSK